MDHPGYFIRLVDNKGYFLHFIGEDEDDMHYKVKAGHNGAAIWTKTTGELFIKLQGIGNVELVPVIEIIGVEPPLTSINTIEN